MRTKRDLDNKIAAATGTPLPEVSSITSYFLRLLATELGRGEQVEVQGFGTFSVRGYDDAVHGNPVTKFHVYVKKSATLLRVLRRHWVPQKENVMEKLGVDESVDQEVLEKAASKGCPECGATCTRHGSTLVCPTHGTEPFEKKSK